MNIRVWSNFSKRQNSTRQPAAADGRQISCVLKEDTSIRNPSFILHDPMPQITYVQAFGNYYFVTDIINMDAHRAEVVCSLDVLATYRSSILGYTAFVERSASSYDSYIIDSALSSQQDYIYEDSTLTSLSSYLSQTGLYATTVLTKPHGLVIYLTNNIEIYRMMLDSGLYPAQNITEWINSGIAASYDLDVYIGSVKWMPLNLSGIGLSQTELAIGPLGFPSEHWPSDSVVRIATPNYRIGYNVAVSLPSAYFNDFRDADPSFVQYSITLPGIGVVPLDSALVGSCIHHGKTLYDYMAIDLSTGLITHSLETVVNNKSVRICDLKGSIACDVPIGKSRANTIETATTYIGGIGAAVSNLAGGGGNPGSIAQGISQSGVATLTAYKSAVCPQASIIGGSGNHTDLYINSGNINVSRRILGSKSFPTAVAGRPLCQNVQLSTLSGFCQCGNASVPVNARDQERSEINAYLNSGFYIE